MRRRLIAVAGVLLGALLVALMVPLVTAYAEDRTGDLFAQRQADATRFSVLAQEALERNRFDELNTDLERYVDVYGGTAVVVNANREVVAASGPAVAADEPAVSASVEQALRGGVSARPSAIWPWMDEPLVLGSPVGRDARVLGAVALEAPTDSLRSAVRLRMLGLAGLGVLVLILTAGGLVGRFVGWVLRPVHELDEAARRLAGGDLSTRVPVVTGPPELRELAGSFNLMADHVETSQQQQRNLIADASHQLGNPLTALRLRVENLRASAAEPLEADLALEETERLNSIVESLLAVSQADAHPQATEPVDVTGRVWHRAEMWAPVIDQLTVDATTPAVAQVTRDLVDVVLDALLDNAAKFAPGCPVHVRVTMTADVVVLLVRDRGRGLAPEDVAHVGARFFRGRAHQNIAGTGLGLAIVLARVASVGGSLAVTSPSDGGLAVQVRLPRVTAAAPGSTAPHRRAGRADW